MKRTPLIIATTVMLSVLLLTTLGLGGRGDGEGSSPLNPDAVPAGSLGLGIIRERAQAIGATLEIDTEFGCGTQVRVVCARTDLRPGTDARSQVDDHG